MDFRISDTFTDSLNRLTGDEQKATKTTAFDLQLNPANPGLSFHKLTKVRDKNFWSVRVTRDIRLIVHKTSSSFLLCYVDHHDKAYSWAERRKLETHPKTGAAQLVEIRELTKEIVVPQYIEEEVVAVHAKGPPVTAPSNPLFGDRPDEIFLEMGVPPEWISDVKAANEDALLDTTIALSTELYSLVCPEKSHLEIKKNIHSLLDSGHVAERFENMVSAQGGPKDFLSKYKKLLPKTQSLVPVKAKKEGYITQINTRALGNILIKMGGGRQKASDKLNLSVGFTEVVKSNEKVNTKKALLMLHCPDKFLSPSLEEAINSCFSISERKPVQCRNPILQKVL